jgi:hypothetical protein
VAPGAWLQGISSWRGVHAGTCYAWPLPADDTCAAVARQAFRDAVSEIGLEPDLLEDCVLMVSELAANTRHAQAVAGAGGGGDRLAAVTAGVEGEPITSAGPAPHAPRGSFIPRARKAPPRHRPSRVPRAAAAASPPWARQAELWLYLRGLGTERELVCKVFDCCRGWPDGTAPMASAMPADDAAGHGLQIVDRLSGGRWGHHPTRARLDGHGLPGKALWFAVPAPLAHTRLTDATGLRSYTLSADVTAARTRGRLSARQAARELEVMLDERGFAGGLVREEQPARDLSILSVRRGLTLWCQAGTVSLTTPWGSSQQWDYGDLVEAAEQTVRRHEELEQEQDRISVR